MKRRKKRIIVGIVATLAIMALMAGTIAPLFMGGYY
jgi:hypothetical protein